MVQQARLAGHYDIADLLQAKLEIGPVTRLP
jgi:hypothetical protein